MQVPVHHISPDRLSLKRIKEIVSEGYKLALSDEAKKRVEDCRAYLDKRVAESDDPIYGINTGFGSLYNVNISKADLSQLQENLVMSHACGTGEEVPEEIVRIMIVLKIQSLCYGHSAIRLETVERLITFFNEDLLPVVFQQGSLGASGDLAPLAHLSLALLGKGEVVFKGERMTAEDALAKLNLEPLTLASKEGLALLNGTQFMGAYGVWSLLKAHKLSYLADVIGAISLEAFDGRIEPFSELIQLARPHNGQIETAKNFRELLEGSQLIARKKAHVQDPYSFRCIPQVHGATKDVIEHVNKVFTTEANSVTDNPTVFAASGEIISAGNFHGQPLAMALDYLAIGMAELANISERRTYKLISGERGLPPFLVANPGINSGFMIPQYTAASIVSQNKQLCTPASVDSIVSSNGQEDHVSMGANAATKLYQVVKNTEKVLAIELLNAAQALEFREDKTSPFIDSFVGLYRDEVPFMKDDVILHDYIQQSVSFLEHMEIDSDILY